MNCALRVIVAALVVAAFGVSTVRAGATENPPSDWDSFWGTFHNPTSWLSMGADFRFRTVFGDNIDRLNDDDVNHEYEFQRYRLRWWTKAELSDDVDLSARLTWETRTWDEPPRMDQDTSDDE